MPRYKEPYTLYQREMKDGKRVWYYRTYDRRGHRTSGKSTGTTNKSRAITYCNKLLAQGRLVPQDDPTMSEWVREYHWWEPDRCKYTAREKLRGAELSKRYIDVARQAVNNHILPRWGDVKLSDINSIDVENWLLSLRATLAAQTCNNILGVLSVMLSEARRIGIIDRNPCSDVRQLAKDSKPRGILTLDEAGQILSPDSLDTLWSGLIRHYTANLIAASTGMRRGEILALRREDIRPDHIHVAHSYDDTHGLKGTKTGGVRDVPLPPLTQEFVNAISQPGFLISANGGETPINGNQLTRKLRRVLDTVKIDWRTRNITFHSWRHWYNTQLRARGIPDSKIRAVTGHATAAMTDNYTGYLPEHYAEVIEAQKALFTDSSRK